ncbi:hypothetical protein NC653_015523 [Populus alba x Populus x berolinensis]|uniref:Uncharacterized protein n=1 Tax=Populus alba x Populus x berolinensis TaxID=444605 RepID=A0AAD6QKT2_9ROSI|nr:hypothetical protein NC653_015523 [Populus alba x Populus x berolinensis]
MLFLLWIQILVATRQAPCHISSCLFFTVYSFPISFFLHQRMP